MWISCNILIKWRYVYIFQYISRLLEHNTLTDSARKILFGLYRSGTYVKPCFHTIFLCTLKLCNRLASSTGCNSTECIYPLSFRCFVKSTTTFDLSAHATTNVFSTNVFRRIFHTFVISWRLATDLREIPNIDTYMYTDTSDRIHLFIRPRSRWQETRLAQFGRYNFR